LKVLALADLHQSAAKWLQLVETVRAVKPDVVAVAGDLLPKENGILAQAGFVPYVRECAEMIGDAGAELVVIPGNDDNQLLVSELEALDTDGLWHYVADRAVEVGGYEFCGCPWIRDFPFTYKYWVAPSSSKELSVNPIQLGPPVIINEHNEIEEIGNLENYLNSKRPVTESLQATADMVKDLCSSIWLIHEPPSQLSLDLCATGEAVGSPVVYRFIEEKQPLLSIHGHIHEAPRYNGGRWHAVIGSTICLQAGQLDDVLCYVTFDIRGRRFENLTHSVYGRVEG